MTEQSRFWPYVGLRAYSEADNDLFYGRVSESQEIAALWQSNRLTVLYGPSGVGKTSLLHAGLIPLLDRRRMDVWPPGRLALAPGIASRNPYLGALLVSWPDLADPAAHSLREVLDARGRLTDRYGDPMPVLIAIDQAEELFLDAPLFVREREEFIAELSALLSEQRGLRLLLSIREDHLAALLPYEDWLGHGARARFQLAPLSRAAALDAARLPMARTERMFSPDAAELLVDELRTIRMTDALGDEVVTMTDTVEPVQLQLACTSLWATLPPEVRVITTGHIREYVDVDQFLAAFCQEALTTVGRRHGLPVVRLRSWLQQTFITELGTRGTAYEGISHTAGMPNAIVRDLENERILRAERIRGSRWYELQHDRLIKPLLQADAAEYLEAAVLALEEETLEFARDQARRAVEAAAGQLRPRARAEELLGQIALAMGETAEAEQHYRTAADLYEVLRESSAVGRVLGRRGRLELTCGRYSQAVSTLRAAVRREPGNAPAHVALATALWFSGQPRSAVIVLDGVLADRGNLIEALRLRGEILSDLGEAVSALRDLDRARRGQGAETLAARALALALVGRLDAAEQEAADALADGGESGPVLLRVARATELRGGSGSPLAWELARRALDAGNPALPSHLRAEAERLAGTRATS
ncbi:MAG TPA: tetratricopeptide repeat protein [Streptosporangiaceae bacterium]|jgi:tetratricopeptide (TPR) repeat protein|nr:tetratricopeptide repeat protein [Streptosporangiaceae bacterium]